ncbi:MAG: YlxR family protein [Clostridia bacterium]|nr:YlxR family protein [Clostridia bacterium]
MRMCVACREMRAKKDLIRVVRTEDGLKLDRTGKINGRGAYLCRDAACLSKAIKIRALERTLEAPLTDELKDALESEIGHDGSAV